MGAPETDQPGYAELQLREDEAMTATATVDVIALRCANGDLHRGAGGVNTAATPECARDAAEFMDEPRGDNTGWFCGPHTVAYATVAADDVC